MSSEIAIRARDLGKVYRLYRRPEDRLRELMLRQKSLGQDFWALHGLDMDVRRGETLGIVGRNGSGKSTLLQLVCGTVQPTTGLLEVHGRVAALLELGAGFNPEYTGRENVYLSATVYGLSETEVEKRFPAIEAFAEIGAFIDQPVRHYSSGMYARLAFSVCAHVDADILVVDEILGVGDAGFQQRCMRFLNSFRSRGTLLFVSHDADAVLSLCDRAIWLDRGKLRACGRTKEVCRRYTSFLSRAAAGHDDLELVDAEAPPAATDTGSTQLKPFDFDLDDALVASTTQMIEDATLSTPAGGSATAVQADEEVELRITVNPAHALEQPVVGFVLRNRLGQVIFGTTTADAESSSPARAEPGQRLKAVFRFRMPVMPTGAYAIEPALFERSSRSAIDRRLDVLFVHVTSHPRLQGLANVVMRQIRFAIGSGAVLRELADPSAAEAGAAMQAEQWRGRNPIELTPFRPDAPSHGLGGARVENVEFVHVDGSPVTKMAGGEEIELRISARAERPLAAPIVGFMLRNALGQCVVGDNTFLATYDADRHAAAGEVMVGCFHFQMPYLAAGDYTLAPSVIDGTQRDHVHLHWMEEALTLRVVDSPVRRSVVGVPMIDVRLETDFSETESAIA